MSKRLFVAEQVADLIRNPNVLKCSPKVISFRGEFKVWAVKQYEEKGLTATQVFQEAGFDPRIIGRYIPKDRLGAWRKKFKAGGEKALLVDGRGRTKGGKIGRPKTKGLTDAERIKRLEAENAYLREENIFLARLRAGKTE
jgi:transposase-like protein